MEQEYLADLPLAVIIGSFILSSALVWFSGTRLSRYADEVAEVTGIGHVVVGTLVLAVVTSLPEVATTITASLRNVPSIAINNVVGGIGIQTALLVVGDIALGRQALTSMVERPTLGLQAVTTILLLSVVSAVILAGDTAVAHVGVGAMLIFVVFIGSFYLTSYFESIAWWESDPEDRVDVRRVKNLSERKGEESHARQSFGQFIKTRLFLYLSLSALGVLMGGYLLARCGEAIASVTGIGESVVGAILIAASTSLPELSTTLAAIRASHYTLAFTNIFGTNMLTVGIVFLSDLFYTGGPVLNEVDHFPVFSAMVGITLTAIYMIGLSMRFKKTIFRMGYDSFLAMLVYIAGVIIMTTGFDS